MVDSHTAARHTTSSQSQDEQNADLDETTSLLLTRTRSQDLNLAETAIVPPIVVDRANMASEEIEGDPGSVSWPRSVRFQVFLCSFFTSMSFAVTQVPLLYAFRLMTCDAYYKRHPSQALFQNRTISNLQASKTSFAVMYASPKPDRCSLREIEASTALSYSFLAASTTIFGIMNLFFTGTMIKRIGVKTVLMIQILLPAVRLFVQNVGIEVWGSTGILIIQCSQVINLIGGPSGYLLCLNTYISEVVEYEGRTAALGRLSGSMMFGSAFGLLLGGVVADHFGLKLSFRLTFAMFLGSMIYASFTLPHIAPSGKSKTDGVPKSEDKNENKSAFVQFFGPLAIFKPRKFVDANGSVTNEFGVFLLAWGVFLGILATGFIPVLLQLVATGLFGFGTQENGILVSMTALLRGVFLTFVFPKLIAFGREYTNKRAANARSAKNLDMPTAPERQPLIQSPTDRSMDNAGDDRQAKGLSFEFDLTYARFSLLADGILTLMCSLVNSGWQMYFAAAFLPFAAGTASASKGTILQMIGITATSAERTDALAGITLVENIARLSTNFAFGALYAAFADIGRPRLVFTCNAATALVGFIVLQFARFPPKGSRRLEDGEAETTSAQEAL